MSRITFISKISRRGKLGYYINIPKEHSDFAEKYHGKYVRVVIEIIE